MDYRDDDPQTGMQLSALAAPWLEQLLESSTPANVATVIVDMLLNCAGCSSATVLWWPDQAAEPQSCPSHRLDALDHELVAQALQQQVPLFKPTRGRLAWRICRYASAVLLMQLNTDDDDTKARLQALLPRLQLAGRQLRRTLELADLQRSHDQLARSEHLQRALYRISELSGSDLDMPSMLRGIHGIVGTLMYAQNFFLVRRDGVRGTMRFLYYADTHDTDGPGSEEIPDESLHGTLTWHLLKTGTPLMGNIEAMTAQIDGALNPMGPNCIDWLGVPMLRDGMVHGALVVQTYVEGTRYTEDDKTLLQFVSSHILTALERKQGKDSLEQHVRERTLELAELNRGLRQQVRERERAEQLQAALFQIAQLATADIDQQAFYRQVHAIVGALINARNFFIAMVDEDEGMLAFPYAVDDTGEAYEPRRLANGFSEYVLEHGALLLDSAGMQAMAERGQVDAHSTGTHAVCWLGVPLREGDKALGLVAVQSYTDPTAYGEAEQELLGFVASQIANSLQRRGAADALQTAHFQLELRVHERTRALRKEIGERERMQQQLRHQVMHDPLTGLANRDHLRERIEQCLTGLQAGTRSCCALLYIDVDRFKIINDSLGHLAGDAVLKEVATRLYACVREPDMVARLSGDEFAILLDEVCVATDAERVAARVIEALAQPLGVAGRELQPSASLGIALGDARYASADELLRDADKALYRAKQLGRKRYEMFDESLARSSVDELGMEADLRQALRHAAFEPHFQPICRLDDGEVVGYEALLRWNHPQRGLLPPGAFLRVAQECGLIETIDWQLFERACRTLRHDTDHRGFLTFNVSALHLRHADFDAQLLSMLARAGLAPGRVIVEVTEGSLLDDPERVRATLERLRSVGVGAALDDFGTGYSSLNYLHSLPLRMLKIDQSFVQALDQGNRNSTTVVEAILALAHALDIQVIAEGIETEHQRQVLRDMGCELGQGFLLGRPAPLASVSVGEGVS